MATWMIVLASLAYVGVLFGIAWFGDRRAETGRSVIRNPVIYTLSIAVYCTSWTFYGAVGSAARRGPEFLTIYLGPTLAFLAWWFVLRKIVRISRANRITSIADFISSRYGKLSRLSALVTLIAVAGTLPYVALQLKAVATSFDALSSPETAGAGAGHLAASFLGDTAFWVAGGMAAFAILFGTRHIDAAEHHEGVVAAIAFESLVKLVAFLAVGLFVTFSLHGGPADLFHQAAQLPRAPDLLSISGDQAAVRWFSIVMLSMCAIVCLPRQFQVIVVENVDERHLSTAAWLFPLYLIVISIFVLPIALSGLLHLPASANADTFVLTVPLAHHQEALALLAFIGGLSSATAMVIVAAITLSTMVCNDLMMPALLRIRWLNLNARGDLTGLLLGIRRTSILLILLLGYGYYRANGQADGLAAIGLISFAATAQFAPAILAGLFWKRATRHGAQAGLALGFALWIYTLLLPSFARSGWLDPGFISRGPFDMALLRPEALFGLTAFEPLSHALFWSWLFNTGALVLVSLFTHQGALERLQAAVFVDVFRRSDSDAASVLRRSATVEDLYALASRFVGREAAYRAFRDYTDRRGMNLRRLRDADPDLVHFTERLLSGSIGAASAQVMVASVATGETVSLDEVMKILEETSHVIEHSHRLEQKSAELERTTAELREANRQLQELDRLKDEFLSTISHELRTPLTSIRSFSEILFDNPGLEREEINRFLGIIISETERLTRLIDQILDLARLEAGYGDWLMEKIDPMAPLETALSATAGLFADKPVRLVRPAALPSGPPVMADRDRLMQVFVNLLSNAVKFAADEEATVAVEVEHTAQAWVITVADNGPGIPRRDRERIFDKFFQTTGSPATGRPSGSGLGLAISRQIVEHFGGRIWVEPAAGSQRGGSQGARFRVSLPCMVATAAVPQSEISPA